MIKEYKPYLSGLIYASIFGLSFMVTKNVLNFIEPFHFLGLRFLAATILMSLLIFFKVIKVDYKKKSIKPILMLSILQPVIYFTGEIYGVKNITSSQAGMMIALIPIFVTILSAIILKEYVNFRQLICIICSVLGVMLITIMQSGVNGESKLIGYFFILAAVLAGAGFSVSSRKLSVDYKPFELTYIMMIVGAVFFNILGVSQVGFETYFLPLSNIDVLQALIYLAFLSSIIAFGLMNYTLSKIPAARAALFANLTTIISIIAGVVLRGEPFFWFHLIGGSMILFGVIGVNRFANKKTVDYFKK